MAPSGNGSIKSMERVQKLFPARWKNLCTALGWVSVTKVTQRAPSFAPAPSLCGAVLHGQPPTFSNSRP
jgi:hypothetical protein